MFWFYFQKGGILMYPLLLCSIAALGLTIERAYYFLKLRFDVHAWFERLASVSSGQEMSLALEAADMKNHPVLRVLSGMWRHRELGREDLETLARESSEEELQRLQRNLKPLGVIATISPLIGLLGTVLGIMKAFLKTSEAKSVDPNLLAGGIYEALITTIAGLCIAIPAWAVYYYFESRVDHYVFLMENYSSRFLRLLHGKNLFENGRIPSKKGVS